MDFLVRGLDALTMRQLKERAAQNGRSLNAEIRSTLQLSVKMSKEETLATARRFIEETRGEDYGDTVAMIREDRDR